jgi:hypothetical protein
MQNVSGFINYDELGRPYMGLLFMDGSIKAEVFLSYPDNAGNVVRQMGVTLDKLAHELINTPNKIVLQKGGESANLRTAEVRKRK